MKVIHKRFYFLFFFTSIIISTSFAVDISLGSSLHAGGKGLNPVWLNLEGGAAYKSKGFTFDMLLKADTSGLYTQPFHGNFFGNFDVQIAHGFISYENEYLNLTAGSKPSIDVVNSPYSLFINGSGVTIPGLTLTYLNEHFMFHEQWMLLGKDSVYDWPDRSAVFKTYAVKINKLRLGFQDSAVAAGTIFDPLDALIPAPSFLIQYIALAPGRPWTADISIPGTNKNSIMGFFADYTADTWYAYSQILVDDLDMNRFFDPNGTLNPDKLAFSLGGHYDTQTGSRLSAYVGLSQKYTFQAFGDSHTNTMYGYTRWPVTAFGPINGVWQEIPIEDNMIGYKNGENNLSIQLGWEGHLFDGSKTFKELKSKFTCEFSLTGAQSPGNPWHEYAWWQEAVNGQNGILATEFLDGRLRTRIRLRADSTMPLGKFLLNLGFSLGYEWNSMVLEPVIGGIENINDQPILRPGNEGKFLGSLSLSVKYMFSL